MSARFSGIKVVPRSLALFWVRDFLMGVFMRTAIFLMVVGAILVYGSNFIVEIFKIKKESKNILFIKTIGLTIAVIGILKIFEII